MLKSLNLIELQILNTSAHKTISHSFHKLVDGFLFAIGTIAFIAHRKIKLYISFGILRINYFSAHKTLVYKIWHSLNMCISVQK